MAIVHPSIIRSHVTYKTVYSECGDVQDSLLKMMMTMMTTMMRMQMVMLMTTMMMTTVYYKCADGGVDDGDDDNDEDEDCFFPHFHICARHPVERGMLFLHALHVHAGIRV